MRQRTMDSAFGFPNWRGRSIELSQGSIEIANRSYRMTALRARREQCQESQRMALHGVRFEAHI